MANTISTKRITENLEFVEILAILVAIRLSVDTVGLRTTVAFWRVFGCFGFPEAFLVSDLGAGFAAGNCGRWRDGCGDASCGRCVRKCCLYDRNQGLASIHMGPMHIVEGKGLYHVPLLE